MRTPFTRPRCQRHASRSPVPVEDAVFIRSIRRYAIHADFESLEPHLSTSTVVLLALDQLVFGQTQPDTVVRNRIDLIGQSVAI